MMTKYVIKNKIILLFDLDDSKLELQITDFCNVIDLIAKFIQHLKSKSMWLNEGYVIRVAFGRSIQKSSHLNNGAWNGFGRSFLGFFG